MSKIIQMASEQKVDTDVFPPSFIQSVENGMTRRIAVTGGRNYSLKWMVFSILNYLQTECNMQTLMHGACPTGLDSHADDWAKQNYFHCLRFPADWSLGKIGGPRRNKEMLVKGKPDWLIAFPGNNGTKGCISIAKSLNIPVVDLDKETNDTN